jgi:hypothetical protein
VSGGFFNTASGGCSGILGGTSNNTCSFANSFIVGSNLCATAECTTFMNNACVQGNVTANCFIGDGGGLTNLPAASIPDPLTVNRLCVGSGHCTTLGTCATIGGGSSNTASCTYSVVSGGFFNTASGCYSTVSGGFFNTASGFSSVVSGGCNTASGNSSTVGGGISNIASGSRSVVSGGYNNTASYYNSTVSGGSSNTASGYNSTVSGGFFNTASGGCSGILGGTSNNTCNFATSFIVGSNLCATAACYTFVNNLCNVGGGTSDCRLKENIKEIPYSTNELINLQPVCYNFISDESKKTKYGFIAQCVQDIMPDLIYHHPTDKIGDEPVLQFDKDAIWASVINAIKDLHNKNIELENKIKELEK